MRHDAVERFITHQEILEFSAAGVGGSDKDDRALVEAPEERLQRLSAEIGMDRDGICAEFVEGVIGVTLVGRTDVATLGVVDHRHRGRDGLNVSDHSRQGFGARRPERFEEGRIGLERAGEIRRRVHDCGAEGRDRVGARRRVAAAINAGLDGVGKLAPYGIEPNRNEQALVPSRFEEISKRPQVSAHATTRHARVSPAHIGTTVSPSPGTSTSAGMRQGSSTRLMLSRLSGNP